jgi:thiamine kinase-like enzyme
MTGEPSPAPAATIDEVVDRVSLWRGREVAVSPLSGGLTNVNYLVEADGARYVVRIPGASTELLAVDRANERHNQEAAATTGVAPRLLEYLDDVRVMVLEFVPGTTMSGELLRGASMPARMASSIRRLHAGPRFLHDFDMFRLVPWYLDIVDRRGVPVPDGYRDGLSVVDDVERAVRVHALPPVPCHNDLLAENYIDDGDRLWILDFEYSGNNDPCFELGNTAQECEFDQELRAELCRAYFGRDDPVQLARMNLHALMSDFGWTMWAAIQATISGLDFDFWGWAVDRWSRAAGIIDSAEFPRWIAAAGG